MLMAMRNRRYAVTSRTHCRIAEEGISKPGRIGGEDDHVLRILQYGGFQFVCNVQVPSGGLQHYG